MSLTARRRSRATSTSGKRVVPVSKTFSIASRVGDVGDARRHSGSEYRQTGIVQERCVSENADRLPRPDECLVKRSIGRPPQESARI